MAKKKNEKTISLNEDEKEMLIGCLSDRIRVIRESCAYAGMSSENEVKPFADLAKKIANVFTKKD